MATGCTNREVGRRIARSVMVGVVAMAGACTANQRVATDRPVAQPPIKPMEHNTTPVRGEVRPLAFVLEGDSFACSTCHEGFEGDMGELALEDTHANITFDHGRNVRCLNCHNPENSEAYVNHDGSEIPADNPTLLCAKCHGPHYREWSLDVHGRVNTYWDDRFGEQKKLACVQCHDPHQPRFQPMVPLPPPVHTRFDLDNAKGSQHD
jgi:hypothetical protein